MHVNDILFKAWAHHLSVETAIELAKQEGFMLTEEQVVRMYLQFARSH